MSAIDWTPYQVLAHKATMRILCCLWDGSISLAIKAATPDDSDNAWAELWNQIGLVFLLL